MTRVPLRQLNVCAINTRLLAYTPYEGLILANQNDRKLEAFGRKLEETLKIVLIF